MSLFENELAAYAKNKGTEALGRVKVILEGTPGYFFNPLIPERMSRIIPAAKVLVMYALLLFN